jgi:hypothetical protein
MRFLRLVMILWLLITALVGSVTLYARTTSGAGELQKLGFGMCEGKPCFMGITPGLTQLSDAMAQFEKNGGLCETMRKLSSLGELRAQCSVGELDTILAYSPDTLIVRSLNVMKAPDGPISVTVGDAVGYWGLPCGFSREPMPFSRFILTYPYVYLDLGYADQWISPGTWVDSILISSFAAPCDRDIPWHGFTISERYVDRNTP